MRHIIMNCPTRVAFLVLLILAVCTSRADSEPKKPTGGQAGIHGHVNTMDPSTKALLAVPGAKIELRQGDKIVGEATSDARGYYAIDQLSAGAAYYFKVTAAGYRDEDYGRGFNLQLTEGDAVKDFTLQKGAKDPNAKPPETPKNPLGQLRGQVYEKTSTGELNGINGAQVYLRKLDTTKLVTVLVSPPTDGQNSSGYFANLEAGPWQIIAQADGLNPPAPAIVVVVADQMADPKDLILFRPASDSPATGSLVGRPEPVFSGGGGISRYVADPSGGGGIAAYKPTIQGVRGTIALADASSKNTTPIRVSIRRIDRAEGSPTPVQLEPSGNFKVDRPPGRYVVTADADGYQTKQSETCEVLPDGYTVVNLKLEHNPAELQVTVYHAERKEPLGEATLRLRRPNEPLSAAAPYKADVAGQFTFKPIVADEYQVLATLTGYKAAGEKVQIHAGETKKIDLYLSPDIKPTTLTVTVTDWDNRQGLGDVTVQVTPAGEKALVKTTDSNGISKFELSKPGQYQLLVRKSGYIDRHVTFELASGENSRPILLQPVKVLEPRLTLIVSDSKKGKPLAGVGLKTSPEIPNGTNLKTDALGYLECKLPKTGRYTIELTKEGYEPTYESLNAAGGNNTERIQLVPKAAPNRLIVHVNTLGDKTPVPGARVVLRSTFGPDAAIRFDGQTDATGTATATPLNAQTYPISVEKDGYETVNSRVTLSTGDSSTQFYLTKKRAVEKPQMYRLTLYIYAGENPILGAKVQVERVAETGTSTDKGSYSCELPGLGKYSVTVTKAGYEPSTTSVTVSSNDVAKAIYLNPVKAEVAKRTIYVLVREGGQSGTVPIDGAKVKILNSKQEAVGEGTTNYLGRFSARGLETGVYTIEASKENYTQGSKPLSDLRFADDQREVPLFRKGGEAATPRRPVVPKKTEVSVPNVVSNDLQTAQTTIQNAGLVFQPAYADAKALIGKATSQQPAAGTTVAMGTQVTVNFVAPGEAARVAADTFGSLTLSRKTGNWGYANGQTTKDAADQLARRRCQGGDGDVIAWVQNGYCAMVFDENYVYGGGLSTDKNATSDAAINKAMEAYKQYGKATALRVVWISSKDSQPVNYDIGTLQRGAIEAPTPKPIVRPNTEAAAQEKYTIDRGGYFARTGPAEWLLKAQDGKEYRLQETQRVQQGYVLYEANEKRYFALQITGGNVATKLDTERNWTSLPLRIKRE